MKKYNLIEKILIGMTALLLLGLLLYGILQIFMMGSVLLGRPSPLYQVEDYNALKDAASVDGAIILPPVDLLEMEGVEYTYIVYLKDRFQDESSGYAIFGSHTDGLTTEVSCQPNWEDWEYPSGETQEHQGITLCIGENSVQFILNEYRYTINGYETEKCCAIAYFIIGNAK